MSRSTRSSNADMLSVEADSSTGSAPDHAASAQPSRMLRLLGRDTGSQSALCALLDLKELVALHCSCREWRRWLDSEQLCGSSLLLDLDEPKPDSSLFSCCWARRFVQRLCTTIYLDTIYNNTGAASVLRVDPLARLLTHFPRIHALQLSIYGWKELNGLQARLVPLCSSLRTLVINRHSEGRHPDSSFAQLTESIRAMPALTSVYISCTQPTLVAMDFGVFATLPQLQSCSLVSMDADFRPSLAQVAQLASCRSLTDLQCGLLLPDHDAMDEAQGDDDDEEYDDAAMNLKLAPIHRRQTEQGIAALVAGRLRIGAAPLRKLALHGSTVTHDAWAHLSQLTSLESLDCVCWSMDVTAEDWTLLARFQSLQSLRLELSGLQCLTEDDLDPSLFPMDAFISSLAHCRALETLAIVSRFSLLTKHVATLAALPRLRSLQLFTVFLESLAPLSAAPALADLQLSRCSAVDRSQRLCARSLVPPLPHLTSLLIYDHSCLRDELAAPLNALLLARCPRLRAEAFRHNQTSVRLSKTTQRQRKETVLRI